ncbi:IS66-like element accessory protein TnpA [Pararhizobium mangrovi]|uniref:Transposase n=1 Tax=Pararhizobium mangrovi TaxID=2590452 RepID=A0A506U177_9HYPH|nr:transposase [Pararhizobium mangrovi]TPW28112.1 transposase [Pararhizobium mangrovi]
MGQMTVFSGPERRRRWSDEERLSILGEAFAPGACVADVARRRDVATSLIYTWRRKFLAPDGGAVSQPRFAEAVMAEAAPPPGSATAPALVIELERGRRISVFACAAPAQIAAALKALR